MGYYVNSTDSMMNDEIASIKNACPLEIASVFRKQPPPLYLQRLLEDILKTQHAQLLYFSVMATPKLPLMRPPASPPPIV